MELFNKILSNKEWIFSGIGVPIVIGLITFWFKKSKGEINQTQTSGDNSNNIQSAHDVTITIGSRGEEDV